MQGKLAPPPDLPGTNSEAFMELGMILGDWHDEGAMSLKSYLPRSSGAYQGDIRFLLVTCTCKVK